ncbi:MAG TPA: poly-beta-1,6-N-acetyl-D-glucosamine N-deacetylase PgaB [Xanthomonadaceae bacterium]|nr:poly-beta-1,6-N-acetyl-D-glucosamine N-deacetylase PgaB [Xanthomonadaceae bacterium]
MNGLLPRLLALLLLVLAWPAQAGLLVLSYHDVRDDVAPKGDADRYAVSTANFVAHLDWLRSHGYHPVSVQQVLDARDGGAELPSRPVLLTFDDGLRSVYTRVFPLLRAYRYPALVAPVTSWVDLPAGQVVRYGPRDFTGDDFVTWDQLREMQASGLVEIGSHSEDLHRGVTGNPYGNQTPAAVTREWDGSRGYEPQADYLARIERDLTTSRDRIAQALGRAPRAMVWPYAAYNRETNAIAARLGMRLSFDLEGRSQQADIGMQGRDGVTEQPLDSLARLLLYDNPDVRDLAGELRRDLARDGMRAMQIDLDYVYDPDPEQLARNLDALVQRIHDIAPSHVFLQAFADPDGDGAAEALYFPNRHLPMRADLFNRAAWQLRTRAGVRVFAWLPVLGYRLPDAATQAALQLHAPDPRDVPRLDPGNPRTRRIATDVYEDLAANAYFEGLLFHDDAYLRDDELPAYGGGSPAARTRGLIDFTLQLKAAAERWRPRLVTVRNLFAQPVLEPHSEAWFAQTLDAFQHAYDYTALMAMPRMENASDPDRWLRQLAARVAAKPGAIARTVFELQSVDWRDGTPLPPGTLLHEAELLRAAGVRHLAYYPDDFLGGHPALPEAREAFSARQFPYLEH